jgi:hypothetical protein
MDSGIVGFISFICLSCGDDISEFAEKRDCYQYRYSVSVSGGKHICGTGKLCKRNYVQGLSE